ncbi:MAG: glutamine-dependent NAD(+) synthetase [Vezdaea aestivalis]|nr:MAG: glutamine-dependent NAD(+) synthetase [Vezdaea aestivalis]
MGHLTTVATCSLNQWALDWDGNRDRIVESIKRAKAKGASLRVGPELEVTGYGCLDHFLEGDVFLNSWEVLAHILQHKDCQDILLDIGMPVAHRNVKYNCRVIIYNAKILLIRPKLSLANEGNYREMRHFTPWPVQKVEDHFLPDLIKDVTGQDTVRFGDAVISTRDTCIGAETCEELFTPNAPHIPMSLDGVEIFTNSSGSHHELRKLHWRMGLIKEATKKCGGIYLYANQQGCDGDRLYYDGCAMILVNGEVVAQGSQFSLNDVEVVTATVDLESVRSARTGRSRALQATRQPAYERIQTNFRLSKRGENINHLVKPSRSLEPRYHIPQEEIALGPACWLWDYLRRSGALGFFVPLSGGIDSCATSVIVFSMCRLVFQALKHENKVVIEDLKRITKTADWTPNSPQDICSHIFHTCYMGSKNSSAGTRARAKDLAKEIGAYHTDLDIDSITSSHAELLTKVTGFAPQFQVHGGSRTENLALQNIQARTRMVQAYFLAQLLPTIRFGHAGGLLVLGSANVDESLRGYLTKYDCSSADINPIGGISKTDLKSFIAFAEKAFELPVLQSFLTAIPTAELEPITETYVQSDEADMGLTYDELSIFGRLRKVDKFGPWSTFTYLLHEWSGIMPPRKIYEKVRTFFYYYAVNRHKMTVLTPSYHAEQYSPDDNRFDLRPFLYPQYTWEWRKIEEVLDQLESTENGDKAH